MLDESGDEEEQDSIVAGVLDEIGIDISGKVSTPVQFRQQTFLIWPHEND